MKLEEIKELIVKASSMENTELVHEFKRASQFSNSLFNFLLDKDKKRNIMPSDIQSAFNFEIKSLIYESELEDRLEKGKESHEYSIELEYKNDDLNAEIVVLKREIQKLKEERQETLDLTLKDFENELNNKDWKISSLELEIKELRQKIADMQKPIEKETE